MKVFILEDDPLRMLWFRQRLAAHEITHADSCTQVERFHDNTPYDAAFFDHDLGGRQMDAHEDNGEAFAKLVNVEHDWSGRGIFTVIHSFNDDGAKAIWHALDCDAYRAPFRCGIFLHLVDRYL